MRDHLSDHIEEIARALLGDPNATLSTDEQLRFGSRGSVAVEIGGEGRGKWYDHENQNGGGPWDLLIVKGGMIPGKAREWLHSELGIDVDIELAPSRRQRRIVATYDYLDAGGAVLFQVVRYEPKDFRQRRPNGNGEWIWSTKGVRLVPYRLAELLSSNGRAVYVVEGEKDCDNLARLGLIATCNPGGAGKWRSYFASYFAGRDVIVLPDNDAAGRKHAEHVAANLVSVARAVRIVALPNLRPKGDVSNFIEGGRTAAELEALATVTPIYSPPAIAAAAEAEMDIAALGGTGRRPPDARGAGNMDPAGSGLIRIVQGELPRIIDEIEGALCAHDPGLYQRGGMIVRIRIDAMKGADERETSALVIRPVEVHHLRDRAMSAATFLKYQLKAKDWFPTDPDLKYFHALLERGRWEFRQLVGTILTPTLRADGSIIDVPGYDTRTGLLFDPRNEKFPTIPANPSPEDARAALTRLLDLVASFPFVTGADRAVWLSVVLTALVRRTLPAAPMHCFSAPTAGSGKSMLVDLAAIIVTGWPSPVLNPALDGDRFCGELDAALLSGLAFVSIDNIATPLDSVPLCQTLTQERRAIRLFHTQQIAETSTNVFIAATGNNLRLVGDLTRRSLVATIDPQVERPETREFATSPPSIARERRGQLVTDALTVLRAFIVAGRPHQRPPLGGFEAWSRLVRDPLVWLGEQDPVGTMEQARQLDPSVEAITAVMEQWTNMIGERRCTVKEVVDAALARTITDFNRGDLTNPDLHSALMAVAADRISGGISSLRLGQWLGRYRDRIVAGRRFVRDGEHAGTVYWVLSPVKPAAPSVVGSVGFLGLSGVKRARNANGEICVNEIEMTPSNPKNPTNPTINTSNNDAL